MAKLKSPGPRSSRATADNDIYTVLLLVAMLFTLLATIYVGYRSVTLFGSVIPPAGL